MQVRGARGYPSLISPDDDGVRDTVTVFASLSQEADWSLAWRDSNSKPVGPIHVDLS